MSRVLVGLCLAAALAAQYRPGWTLVWSDEFDGHGLDPAKWEFDVGGHGWGNNESQCYTRRTENAAVEDGKLVIRALRETYTGPEGITRPYTSARLVTRGKFSRAYGRFEALIKLPYGPGIWPAFWMLGDDIATVGWPACGEIDIMENIGREPSTVHGTIHGPGYSGSRGIGASYTLPGGRRFADDFHLFAVEWEPEVIRWYVDDVLYQTRTPKDLPSGARWVFDHPFHLLLNVAVGGNWPGYPDQTTVFPQTMLIDYVRVYARAAKPSVRAPGGVVNAASFREGFAPGSWVTVLGTELAGAPRPWRDADIVSGKLPEQLDGVGVRFNGKPGYVAYVSPGQINVLAPQIHPGPVEIRVIRDGVPSDPVTAEARTFDPAFFLWAGKYVVATRTHFTSLVAPQELFPGRDASPARPGEIVILWGTGFGPTDPPAEEGRAVSGERRLRHEPEIRIGGLHAEYLGGALTPGSAGLYQIAVRVPETAPDGELPLTAAVGEARSPDNVFLAIER
ncbi:MAG: family 16 glycosylhydrolase [Bryobacteraceae bacterium]|nr:family 16 glycosylhydrolase [Bryobacteraceae bacterium]